MVVCLVAVVAHAQAPLATRDSSQAIAERIIKSEIPVVIDFWATWCAPCKVLSPMIEEIAKEYDGKVKVMKVDVDVHRQIAGYFGVRAVPSVFIVHNKAVVQKLAGLQPKEAYVTAIEQVLSR
jgi:thioredoxin 1